MKEKDLSKTHIRLQASEAALTNSAAQIYAAYIIAGKVPEGEEAEWKKRAATDAIELGRLIDNNVISENEIES